MLNSFKEINHPIYTFHDHLYYIFQKIFEYDLDEYDESILVHPDFLDCINASETRLLNPIKELVGLYHKLPYGDKITLQIALSQNNCLSIFEDTSIDLIPFSDLHPSISEKLKTFFESLWSDYPQNRTIENKFGTVKDHYDKLTHEDNFDFLVCPFCGIDSFEPAEGLHREEYDHLLAKASYPFLSINFKLLFPCCKKCNQQEKKKKDPLYEIINPLYKNVRARRIAHYPYDSTLKLNSLSIQIKLKNKYNNETLETLLRSVEWEIVILRNGVQDDRDESWDEVYGIKRRFTERLGRLEKQWYSELIRKFKTNTLPFNKFVDNYREDLYYQIPIAGTGIIKLSYFNFIFSIPNIEDKLQQVTVS